MRTVIYSLLFIAAFYAVGMACELLGFEDQQAGIPMLIGIFVVLGLFIAGKNNKGE